MTGRYERDRITRRNGSVGATSTGGIVTYNEKVDMFSKEEWADKDLAQIATEAKARDAYQFSKPLKEEFTSVETFVAYWRALTKGQIRVAS